MSPILIVEDEYFLADECVSEANRRGLRALPVGHLDDAIELAQTADLDGAVVDLNLRSESGLPVVELLRQRMIPVVFYTGCPELILPERFRSIPLFRKPLQLSEALDGLTLLMKPESHKPIT